MSSSPVYFTQGPPLISDQYPVGKQTLQGFSSAISYSGNVVVSGAPATDFRGAVFVFTRDFVTWNQHAVKLFPNDGNFTSNFNFGNKVAINSDGNVLVAAALGDSKSRGAVWVFAKNATDQWEQQGHKLVGTNAVTKSLAVGQGCAVAINGVGDTVASGGSGDDNVGAVWMFVRNSTGFWNQQGEKITVGGLNTFAYFGSSVSLSASGDTLAVGAMGDGGTLFGAVYMFTRTAGVWTQYGSKLVGTGYVYSSSLFLGVSVSMSAAGDVLVAGASGDSSRYGAAWVFALGGDKNWTQVGSKLVGSNGTYQRSFGTSVSISGNGKIIAVGGQFDGGNSNSRGALWMFGWNGTMFEQLGEKLVDMTSWLVGCSTGLSYDGSTAIAGAYATSPAGAVFVYVNHSMPTIQPTALPTIQPSHAPSVRPTVIPSSKPTLRPSAVPSIGPTTQPSHEPTTQPTNEPTVQPSTSFPTVQPSKAAVKALTVALTTTNIVTIAVVVPVLVVILFLVFRYVRMRASSPPNKEAAEMKQWIESNTGDIHIQHKSQKRSTRFFSSSLTGATETGADAKPPSVAGAEEDLTLNDIYHGGNVHAF